MEHQMRCGKCGGVAVVLSPKRPRQSKAMRCAACRSAERERDLAELRERTKGDPGWPIEHFTVAARRARGIDT